MRKLGLIGGMSWVATRYYYEQINRLVQRRVSPMSSARMLVDNLDFRHLFGLKDEEDWKRATEDLIKSAKRLEKGGAQAIVIGANSMHRVYMDVADAVDIPIIHIADCVGDRMQEVGCTNAALIGTRNVMTEGFYRRRLVERGVDLATPDMDRVEVLHRIIYEELMVGKVRKSSERELKTMFTKMQQDGVQAIVLACTELSLIVDVDANVLPIYDSARIHCEAAVNWMLEGEEEA